MQNTQIRLRMKTIKFFSKLLLSILLAGILPASALHAQQYEKSREESKGFPAGAETTIQVVNKYGNIHVLPWDKDSVRFDVSIRVESGKQSKVEKTFENISIEFTESMYYVIAQTVFGNQKSAFWTDVTDLANSMLSSGSAAQIDYTIYVPADNELSIENKFGNVYMTDHRGKVVIKLSNGDFRGGSFKQMELEHSFGNVIVDNLASASLELSYSELKLKKAGELRITSKSSKATIESSSNIRINSRRDTYYFDEAGMINGETSFSYLTFHRLNGDLILTTNYGSLGIDSYGKGFSMLNVAAAYTDISSICNSGFNYYLETYYDQKTRMIYPQTPPIFGLEEIDKDAGQYLLSGHVGSNAENIPRLKFSLKGGSFNLVQQ